LSSFLSPSGYQTLIRAGVFYVIRSTVIIDPDGRIAYRWKRVKSKGHAEKVRERLDKLRIRATCK